MLRDLTIMNVFQKGRAYCKQRNVRQNLPPPQRGSEKETSGEMDSKQLVSSEVDVNLRPTVSRPVCLGVGPPSGTRDQIFFLLEISLDSCGFVIL
jgi:hypothetical protein